MKPKFDFNDIAIVPERISRISSRDEVNIYDENGMLPLFAAPMDTVVDMKNYKNYLNLGVNVCLPRGYISINDNLFQSLSLEGFEMFVEDYENDSHMFDKLNILVDVANGHMLKLYTLCEKFVSMRKNPNHKLMIGNVANPKTFQDYAVLGVDYVRVGIGGGSGCLTSANTGVHYPMASLIEDCYEIKQKKGLDTKIVADGGMKKFDDIIKALVLGADYVMIGGLFNKSLESCGDNYLFNSIKISQGTAEYVWENLPYFRKFLTKSFRGMSTKDVQRKWNRKVLRTSEGISKKNKVEYTLDGWVNNFSDYLRSTMSYTNSYDLEELKDSTYTLITEQALKRFNK